MKYDNTIIDLNAIRKGKVGHEIINALIENQADTIEELCDEFVIVFKDKKIVEKDFKLVKTNYGTYDSVYGAIWTYDSNGAPTLKPVAKMNDKGELELL